MKIGEKIKQLRKHKNLSQEILAQSLGVSFQTISKWENGITMPDVMVIPSIASFFGISIDELYDFNLYEIEKNVDKICKEAVVYRESDPQKAEMILKEGLAKYPGNDILLNNLLYTMRSPQRHQEVIQLCKALIESTKYDDVKYDALRILAETYHDMGEYESTKVTIQQIPEIYFTKLELDALLLEGDDMFESACRQKYQSACMLIEMLKQLSKYYRQKGDTEKEKQQMKIAMNVVSAFKDDEMVKYYDQTIYQMLSEEIKKLC